MSSTWPMHLAFLRQTPLFAGCDKRTIEAVARDFVPRHFASRSLLFNQGDPGQSLYLLKQGQVRIFVHGLDGHETSVILYGQPGALFGELAIIDGLPRSAAALAVADTVVYTMERDAFRAHMRRSPQLALNFMKVLSQKVRYNTRQMDSLASLDVTQRLARTLLELGQNYGTAGAGGVRLDTTLTQGELASLVGATRERINRVLREFRDKGLILIEEGNLTILDVAALREAVG